MSYLNLGKLNPQAIVNELYDLSKRGAVGFPNVIKEAACDAIVKAFKQHRHLFISAERVKGKVIQEVEMCYLERLESIPQQLVEAVSPIVRAFEPFYQQLASGELDTELRDSYLFGSSFNSTGVHYYPKGTAGISPHKDFTSSRNLIVIFVLKGDATLYSCKNRKGDNKVLLASTPGSLIILRAARNPKEQKCRPFHVLEGPMSEDRYSLILRQEKGLPGESYA